MQQNHSLQQEEVSWVSLAYGELNGPGEAADYGHQEEALDGSGGEGSPLALPSARAKGGLPLKNW